MKRWIFLSIFIFTQSQAAVTGDMLLHWCLNAVQASNGNLRSVGNSDMGEFLGKAGGCIGYIQGVNDTTILANNRAICVPAQVTYDQLSRLVYQYLDNNPKYLAYDASPLVFMALSQAFPCVKK